MDLLGGTVPAVSLYFLNLVIVKVSKLLIDHPNYVIFNAMNNVQAAIRFNNCINCSRSIDIINRKKLCTQSASQ